MPTTTDEPVVTKVTIAGIEIPVDSLPSIDDEKVSQIFEVMAALDDSEQPRFILSTSTAAYR
jgi:hypothetical protein